jgi:SMC interacting uncharacterized protein involved in chromosome segregation
MTNDAQEQPRERPRAPKTAEAERDEYKMRMNLAYRKLERFEKTIKAQESKISQLETDLRKANMDKQNMLTVLNNRVTEANTQHQQVLVENNELKAKIRALTNGDND